MHCSRSRAPRATAAGTDHCDLLISLRHKESGSSRALLWRRGFTHSMVGLCRRAPKPPSWPSWSTWRSSATVEHFDLLYPGDSKTGCRATVGPGTVAVHGKGGGPRIDWLMDT